jgi:Ni/Fe-hydrogenase b-type cytochrome subunit
MGEPDQSESRAPPAGGDLVRRHRLPTRLWHWLNAATVLVLLMSGLTIFNAHPRLYWGEYGANPDPAWFEMARDGGLAFPGWMTLPSTYNLADARMWHLAFAWVLGFGLLAYLLWALLSGHIRHSLHLAPREWRLAHLWREMREHARLRLPAGAEALRYNALQKIAYCTVLFVLLPLLILTGLTMSPGMNAAWPILLDLFGGRQSARSLHFIAAAGLVAFFLIHVAMVLLAGPFNELRGMITGWYRLPRERS